VSFIKPDTIPVLLQQPGFEPFIYRLFQWIHLFLLVFVFIYFINMVRRKDYRSLPLARSFFWMVFLVLMAITLSLLVLSLRIATDKISSGYWTFLQDARYYGLALVLIQLSLFVFCQHNNQKKSKLFKYTFPFFLLLFLPEVFRGTGFIVKRAINFNKEEYSWQHDCRFQKYAAGIVDAEKKKHAVEQVVLTGSEYLNNRVTLEKYIPRMYTDTLINNISSLHTKRPVVLLVIIQDIASKKFSPFVATKGVEAVGRFENFSFYSYYLDNRP
jgi:hypothetical protein